MKHDISLAALGLTIAAIIAVNLPAKTAKKSSSEPDPIEVSWAEFCRVNGYDTGDNSAEIVNEYLDTWVGSVAEAEALSKFGIEKK